MLTKTKSISSVFLFNTMLIVSLCITGLSFFWISHEYKRFNKEVKILRDEYIETQKLLIKNEINRVIHYIQHERLHYDGDLKKLQSKLLDRIGRIRYKKNQYIIVNRFDGTILAHYKQKNIGKNMWNFIDKNGVKTVQEAIKVAKNENGGYVTYVGSIRPSTGRPAEKITYAKSIPDWEWVVSTGVYMDDIEAIISNKKIELNNTLKNHSLKIATVIFFLFVCIILITVYFSKKIKKDFDIFTSFFKKSAVSNVKIDKDKIQIEEFAFLSDSANHMIDKRKKAEFALKESEKHLRSLMESATNFVVYKLVSDKTNPHQLKVKFVSPSIKDILGIPEPMKFETWFKSIHSEDIDRIAEANLQAFKTLKFNEEYRTYHQNKNEWRWIHAISTGVVDKKGATESVNGILLDVTDRKLTEQLLRKSEKQLKSLNNHIIYTEERERNNLATGLHDSAAQTLGLSISKIKMIQEPGNLISLESIAEIQGYLEQTVRGIRSTIYQLSPPVLKDFNIDAAIGFLIEEINEKYHADITYINNLDTPVQLVEAIKITLYRAGNELILNIIKHAGVKKAELELSKNETTIFLRVEDKGVGFDVTSLDVNNFCGFGLYGLSERCKNMNGNFKIESELGKGTKAVIYFSV